MHSQLVGSVDGDIRRCNTHCSQYDRTAHMSKPPFHTQYPTMFAATSVEPDVFSDSLTYAFALEGTTSEFSHVVAELFVEDLILRRSF